MALSIFNTIFFFAFLLSAAVQYNDPDATAWIAAYLCAAYMCFAQVRQKLPRLLPLILLLGSMLGILFTMPSILGEVSWGEIFESVTMRTRAVEEAREIGGLAIIGFWSGVLYWHQRTLRQHKLRQHKLDQQTNTPS
ncbi:MAG: transmembrane 220 family protein [Halioglobus sp.]